MPTTPRPIPLPGPTAGPRRLFLFHSMRAGGLLEIESPLAGMPPLLIKLDGRHVRFLLVLAKHWRETSDDPVRDALSYVPAGQVARELYGSDERAYEPEEQAVRAYAAQLNGLIRAATPAGTPPPLLHQSAPGFGFRLTAPLEIVLADKPK